MSINIKEDLKMAYEELMDKDISYAFWVICAIPCFWLCSIFMFPVSIIHKLKRWVK